MRSSSIINVGSIIKSTLLAGVVAYRRHPVKRIEARDADIKSIIGRNCWRWKSA